MKNNQKKKRNKKYQSSNLSKRLQDSKGERVKLSHGGKPEAPEKINYQHLGASAWLKAKSDYENALAAWEAEHNDPDTSIESGPEGRVDPNKTNRTIATGQQAELLASGNFSNTNLPTIPDAEKIPLGYTTLAETRYGMDKTDEATASEVGQTFDKGVTEQVAQGTTDTAQSTDVNDVSKIEDVALVSDTNVAVDKATGNVTKESKLADQTLTEKAVAADINDDEAAKGMADKVTGTISAESTFEGQKGTKVQQEEVTGAEAETRTGKEITTAELNSLKALAQERGIKLEELPEYQKASARTAQTGTAATKKGNVLEATAAEEAAKAEYYGADYTPQANNTEIDDTPNFKKAAVRKAQVAEAKTKIAQELGTAPSVDLEGREAATGTAPQGDAAQIGGIPTLAAAQMEAVQGKERIAAAADMMKVVADVPEETTAAIAEDPATVEAQIDEQPVEVTAAIAALPVEALVSTQMSGLLAGMEDGETPLWAKPAIDAINQQLAARGMSVSTVGRDAMFNAIIQSALPMAQSNAQALQQRAQQNLSNQQSANLQQAQSSMQLRMQNLSNRQTAASQTADMAQQIKIQQGTFNQQAAMTTSQQRQDVNVLNAQMGQQRAQQESSQRQQAAISTLSVNAQMDLANLQAESTRAGKQLDADQQVRLTKYNAQVAKVMRQADLAQDMEKANLSGELQVEMQRISELNAAAKDTMTAEQTERLTNLQTLIDFRKTDANFAQQMDLANMSNEQQVELANLQERAATDSANFTTDNQFRLSELNAKVQRATRQAELTARMKEVNLDSELKVELSELTERNATSRANMSADQQMRLTNLQNLVNFRKSNAELAQQMDLANLGNEQQMELANLSERSATDAANFTEDNRFRMQELNTTVQVLSQNQQLLQTADMAKLSTSEKVSLANLTSKNQADSESMSAENQIELANLNKRMAAAQTNAQLAQQLGLAELSNDQQAAMNYAQVNANMDMANFSAEQQTALANSKFMQTVQIQNMSAEQQSIIQNATAMAGLDLANLSTQEKLQVENAKNFLTMDMANLNNDQQANMLRAQQEQQRLLSDQSATNVAKQFNATSENQVSQFMANLTQTNKQFNTSQLNSMEQFNTQALNAAEARRAGREGEAEKLEAQLKTDISKFNAQLDFQREEFNSKNETAIAQSNVAWRRQANTIDTAAQNSINQQNAQNAFGITASAMNFLWQELRDEADFNFRRWDNNETRKTSIYTAALGNDTGATSDSNWSSNLTAISTLINGWLE